MRTTSTIIPQKSIPTLTTSKKPVYIPDDIDSILSIKQVSVITKRSRASIYRDMASGDMPQSIRVGKNSIGFMKSSIVTWLNSRLAASGEM